MLLYGKIWNKQEILSYYGDVSAVAGINKVTGADGFYQDTPLFFIKTGAGLCFTVVPGRSMDIAEMHYKGIPLCYISKSGIKHASYSLNKGYEWLRSFFGGALTTCGLTHVGEPELEGNWELPCHGRISGSPANETNYRTCWQGDDLILSIDGKVRESVLYEENLQLFRRIHTKAGENRLYIDDEVENLGFSETPLMILYHMNFGFPIFSADSTIILPTRSVESANEGYPNSDWGEFHQPSQIEPTRLYYHTLSCNQDGWSGAALYNNNMQIGIYIRFSGNDLPCFSLWKNMQCQDYVIGFEPGNCYPIGRKATRDRHELHMIQPGERKRFSIEMGVIDGDAAWLSYMDLLKFESTI